MRGDGAARSSVVGMTFEVAGEAYDRFMGRYSRPLAGRLADWLEVPRASAPSTSGAAPAP